MVVNAPFTHAHTATARMKSHVHFTCTSYVLYVYLYCVYVLVGGTISIRNLYICAVHESVPFTSLCQRIACCLPQVHCLCSENVGIGFKTSIEAYFMKRNSARTLELLEVS